MLMGMLSLHGISKSYGNTKALDELRFEVAPGQMFGFVGPNGAGKTTAMRIVIGVLAPDSGTVIWDGAPMDADSRRQIGYMPEERGLYPKMRVADQLVYHAELHGIPSDRAAEQADKWTERLGIAERRDDKVEDLSLGNQQRVQLAAALVHEPKLLILDEPFSGLDPIGVDVLSEVLIAEAHERAVPVVFSSHQLDLVERLCDAVAIVKDGSLVASGEVEQLRSERSGRRWRVELVSEAAWTPSLPGVRPVADDVFELDEGVDPQALLDEARKRGAVRQFGPDELSLADLFRDVVAEES